jgi:hypothetical protein
VPTLRKDREEWGTLFFRWWLPPVQGWATYPRVDQSAACRQSFRKSVREGLPLSGSNRDLVTRQCRHADSRELILITR